MMDAIMSSSTSSGLVPLTLVISTGCLTMVLASLLTYVLMNRNSSKNTVDNKEASFASDNPHDPNSNNNNNTQQPKDNLYIYFCTQTGTAESFARQLEREGTDLEFCVHVIDIEDASNNESSSLQSPAIFLSATYGEGEPPDHANAFVQRLKEKAGIADVLQLESSQSKDIVVAAGADPTFAAHLEYAVFGLGNQQYDHYNAMGKFLDKALECAGGKRLLPLGLGNDDDDLENDFEIWKDTQLWPTLQKNYKHSDDSHVNGDHSTEQNQKSHHKQQQQLPECPLQIIYHEDLTPETCRPDYNLPPEQIHSSSRHYFTAVECPVTCVQELRDPSDGGSTVHVEIDTSQARSPMTTGPSTTTNNNNQFTYTTAANLGVLPVNDTAVVERVAAALHWDLNAIVSVQASAHHEWHGAPFPMPVSVRECLERYCDLTVAPRRSDLKLLAKYCRDPVDQQALQRLAAKEGRLEYKEKILEHYVGWADLICDKCRSIQMPLEHFLNLCPPLQSRFFTIASSSLVHPKSIHLTVAVTQHARPDGKSTFRGVCSNYLARLVSNGDTDTDNKAEHPPLPTVRVFHRPSTFCLPSDPSRPILMIGPGTGIAPMRALLQERQYQKHVLKQANVGPNILYFGCKKPSQDYIYRDELQAWVEDGTLHQLHVAFSREQTPKIYVQDLLRQHAAATWNLLDRDQAHVYVCGAVRMGHDVSETLQTIVAEQGNLSLDEAKQYLARLGHEGRFVQELWA